LCERCQDEAQQGPQPGEDEAQVVADCGKDGVRGVAGTALEVAAAEVTVGFMCPITASMAERRRSSRLMTPKTPRFWPEMKTRRDAPHVASSLLAKVVWFRSTAFVSTWR
jgi:hypothetical protein